MKIRVYAEVMSGSTKWQVIKENLISGEREVVLKDLHHLVALGYVEELQKAVDRKPSGGEENI